MINKLFIKDNKGQRSVTLTVFFYGSMLVNLKLVCSGWTLGGFTLSPFSGVEYAAAIGALGAVYVMRRNTDGASKGPENV